MQKSPRRINIQANGPPKVIVENQTCHTPLALSYVDHTVTPPRIPKPKPTQGNVPETTVHVMGG